jgi:hypothetical protein
MFVSSRGRAYAPAMMATLTRQSSERKPGGTQAVHVQEINYPFGLPFDAMRSGQIGDQLQDCLSFQRFMNSCQTMPKRGRNMVCPLERK